MKIESNFSQYDFNNNKTKIQQNVEKSNSIFSDKNGNGIIDKDDFTEQEWHSINGNGLTSFFNGQKWSDALSNLFSRIFNKENIETSTANEPITIIQDDMVQTKSTLIFDDKTKTLKIAEHIDNNEYTDYKEIKYDDNGNVESTKDFERNKYVRTSDNRIMKFSARQLSDFIETQGFDRLGERKYSDDEIQYYMNMAGHRVWEYEDSQKSIRVNTNNGSYTIATKETDEIYNINDKLISKTIHKSDHDEILNYDEQGTFLNSIIRTEKDDKITDYIKNSNGDKYIYEYDIEDLDIDGNVNHKKVIILDENDKPIISYFSKFVFAPDENGRMYYEIRTYEDGHEEKLNLDKSRNIIK